MAEKHAASADMHHEPRTDQGQLPVVHSKWVPRNALLTTGTREAGVLMIDAGGDGGWWMPG